MKKQAVLFFALILACSLTACGGTDPSGDASGSQTEGSMVENSQQTQAPGGNEASGEQNLQTMRDAVAEVLGENYWPNTQMPPEYLEGYGLTEEMYDAFFGELPMISANVDQLIIIRSADGYLDEVEQVMEAYRDALVNDTMQYPMNLGKIQASRIQTIGEYVCFVQLGGDVTDAMDSGDEAVIRQCQEQNELAIAALEKAAVH